MAIPEQIKLENEIIKQENDQIKQENEQIRNIIQYKQDFTETSDNQDPGIIIPNKITHIESFINTISKIDFQRWYTNVKLIVEDFEIEIVALIDSEADMNCIQEGIILTKYYEKTGQELFATNKGKLEIEFKLQNIHICQNNYYFRTQFILVQNMTEPLILGTHFITLLYPFQVTDEGVKTTILGNTIFFPFIYPLTKKEIHQVQSDSINKRINLIKKKTSSYKFFIKRNSI